MASIDPARWPEISRRLDELLDLGPLERSALLDRLRADEPAVADELAGMLQRMQALDAAAFLEAPALDAPAGLEGQSVGAYTLVREIGQGGMGSVWLARRTDGRYEGLVAIKFLQAGLFGRAGSARFAREGSILARLDHPHIARMLDAGVTADRAQPYLVLEYIDGLPIDRHCAEQRLGTHAVLRLFLDVLAAVAHAHTRLILHRDLKPSNILVTTAGEVKLLDFGIAKLLHDASQTGTGPVTELTKQVGAAYTPHFATPEQVQGGEVTTATDVYALGVLLYLLLSGRHPTLGVAEGELDRLRAVVEAEPRRLSEAVALAGGPEAARRAREIRGDLDTVLAKALKKAPGERYANAAALAEDLRRWLAHEPIAARPDSRRYRLAKFVRRNRIAVAAGSAATLALALGIGVALQQGLEARRQQVAAEGLIEFMLGDLRKKLEPVGRLDALDAVGEKALGYYAAQQAGRLDAESLSRRAKALHLIGELAEQRGQLDKAARSFSEAAGATAALLAREPTDPQRIFDQAQSEYWVGFVAYKRGEAALAELHFNQYLAHAKQLLALDPQDPKWQAELAYAQNNLGVLYLDAMRLPKALQAFNATTAIRRKLVLTRPDTARDLAMALGWLARAHDAGGSFQQAIDVEREKIAVVNGQPGAAQDKQAQYLLANAQQLIARRLLALGQQALARQAAGEALDAFLALNAHDPANLFWQEQTALGRLLLIDVAVAQDDLAEVRGQVAALDATLLRQAREVADKPNWQLSIGGGRLLAQLRLASDRSTLRAPLANFLDATPRFVGPGKQLSVGQSLSVAAVGLAFGDLLQEAGEVTEARARWQAAADMLAAHAEQGQLASMALRAIILLRMNRADEARALAQSLQSSAYRHPRYHELRRALLKWGTELPIN